jgi:hypothetical protein
MAKTIRRSHLVRQDVTRFAPDSDARWRAEYRQAQYERALVGIQSDLFGAPAIEVFRPVPKVVAPEAPIPDHALELFHDLSPEEQARRLAADPQTPFARSARVALTEAEKAALIAAAANWLRVGQRVHVVGAPPTLDGTVERRVGRTGVVWRLCSTVFADHVYVNLDLIGAERSEKIAFLELRDVEPVGTR